MAPSRRSRFAKAPPSKQPTSNPNPPEASMTYGASSTSRSASREVFTIVELLEHILLDVADVTKTKLELKGGDGLVAQPSRQLIALTRVNRTFRDTILGSKKLEAAKFDPLLTTSNEHEPLEWMAHALGLDIHHRGSIKYGGPQHSNGRLHTWYKEMPMLQFRTLYIDGDVYLPKKLKHARKSDFAVPEAAWRQLPFSSATNPDPLCLTINVRAKYSHYREHLVMQEKGAKTLGAMYDWLVGIVARSEQRHIWLGQDRDRMCLHGAGCGFRIEGVCSELCSGSSDDLW